MKSERWQQIDQLFQEAVELELAQRPAFLDEVCRGDEPLRGKLTAMLSADDRGWKLLEPPALEVGAPLLAVEQPQLAPGHHLSRYQIVGWIGRGGMGEVYLARDEKLNRKVALKLLPVHYTQNKDQMRRFEQEAQASSALNHPNILTIYEFGQDNDQQFIATEFVEGETLRDRMKRGELGLTEALDVAIQVAGALAAAHDAGIVHRDIKPENIMLRPDGYVKVVDFGLAKLTEQDDRAVEVRANGDVDISGGVVLGTIEYMSPEQARGLRVDPRSDIFSLGVVLYEMVTGRAPFEGKTSSDVIDSILHVEPKSLPSHLPVVPDKLSLIVDRLLSKNREQRYQTARDVLVELNGLKEEVELESKAANRLIGRISINSLGRSLVREYEKHKTRSTLVIVALAIAIASLSYFLLKSLSARAAPFQTMSIARLPGTQHCNYGVISPDGKHLAHVVVERGKRELCITNLETSDKTQIVPPATDIYAGLTFSPDGSRVYYVSGKGEFATDLYELPTAGGEARRVLNDVDGPITFSPDGDRFAFVRVLDGANATAILVANTDGSGERELARRKYPEYFNHAAPSWSPDGSLIASPAGNVAGQRYANIVQVLVDTGVEQPITSRKWGSVEQVAWLSDGSGLVFIASESLLGPRQVWSLSYPAGNVRRITNDLNSYARLSLTADSKRMATVRTQTRSSAWRVPEQDAHKASQITDESFEIFRDIACLADGRVAFVWTATDNREIWIMNADGSDMKQLTADGFPKFRPSASADGQYIVFASRGPDAHHIWRMNADGSNPQQLTSGVGENAPSCSPDGWVVYASGRPNETPGLWKVRIEGGSPVQTIDKPANFPRVSPDGTLVACWYKAEPASSWKIAIIPFNGSSPIRTLDLLPSPDFRWMPDGRSLNYVVTTNGVSNLWSQPIDGGPPRQLTNFASLEMYGFDFTREGTLIASRGFSARDLVLIKDSD